MYKLMLGLIAMVMLSFSSFAQQTVVSGTVTDAKTKETLPYVSFLITGSTKGGRTDLDGKYKIVVEGSSTEIKFSYIGYKTQAKTVKAGGQQTINIQLESESTQMDEVVIRAG
ncbi:MAG: carboxypeptidase-like regulatory domain-containing protein, partial [Pedobacter sp.]